MWKKILIGFVGFVVLVITLVMYATSGMTDVAELFFDQMRQKQYDKAYSYLSEDFKRGTSREALIAFLKKTGLEDYKSASWGNRSFEGKRGEIEGTVETTNGGAVPVTVKFIKLSDGEWKIYAINKPVSGTHIDSTEEDDKAVKLPSDREAIALVKNTILQFSKSVKSKDMSTFHSQTSKLFQKRFNIKKLNDTFVSFMKLESDLTVLNALEPVLDPKPLLQSDDTLVLKGYYNTAPSRFYYDFKYIREDGEWKIGGINVELK